jgi:hypothetical protein
VISADEADRILAAEGDPHAALRMLRRRSWENFMLELRARYGA